VTVADTYRRFFAKAFESDESFLDLLKREVLAGSGACGEEHAMPGESIHLEQEKLLDYVVGTLENDETEKVMAHIAGCRLCAFRALEMTRLGEEGKRDVLEWVDTGPPYKS
jgi:hypothetical protein